MLSPAAWLTAAALAARRPYQEHPHRDPMRGLVQAGQYAGGGRSAAPTRDAPVPEGGDPPAPGEQEGASRGRPPRKRNPMDL